MRSLYASSGPKDEGVPTNNHRDGDQDPVAYKARHIVPTALLVRVQCLRNNLYRAVEGPNTRPIVLSMIAGSYFRRRKRLTILEPDQTNFAWHLTLLSL